MEIRVLLLNSLDIIMTNFDAGFSEKMAINFFSWFLKKLNRIILKRIKESGKMKDQLFKKIRNFRCTLFNLLILSTFLLFLIWACNDTYQLEPVVATLQVPDSLVTSTSAKVTGQILVLGTQNITEHGIELYKTSALNLTTYKGFTNTATTDTFTVVFTGLDPNTTYYYWAYALVNTTRVHSQLTAHFKTKAAR